MVHYIYEINIFGILLGKQDFLPSPTNYMQLTIYGGNFLTNVYFIREKIQHPNNKKQHLVPPTWLKYKSGGFSLIKTIALETGVKWCMIFYG